MSAAVFPGRMYRHVRTGSVYQVMGVALSCEQPLNHRVVYMQITRNARNEQFPNGTWWSRPLQDFCDKFSLEEKN